MKIKKKLKSKLKQTYDSLTSKANTIIVGHFDRGFGKRLTDPKFSSARKTTQKYKKHMLEAGAVKQKDFKALPFDLTDYYDSQGYRNIDSDLKRGTKKRNSR